MDSVVLDGELDTDTAETAFQFRCHFFQVLCRNVSRVGIQFCQNLWHCLFHKVGHVDGVHILVIDNAQQSIQLVRRAVDNAESVAGKVFGIKCTYQNSDYHTDSDDDRGKP